MTMTFHLFFHFPEQIWASPVLSCTLTLCLESGENKEKAIILMQFL